VSLLPAQDSYVISLYLSKSLSIALKPACRTPCHRPPISRMRFSCLSRNAHRSWPLHERPAPVLYSTLLQFCTKKRPVPSVGCGCVGHALPQQACHRQGSRHVNHELKNQTKPIQPCAAAAILRQCSRCRQSSWAATRSHD
jgi:hypothetical protein